MLSSSKATDVGRARQVNEDRCDSGTLGEHAVWAIVCDGLGGMSDGSVASSTAVDIIGNTVKALFRSDMQQQEIFELLRSALYIANTAIHDRVSSNGHEGGMATTAVVAVVVHSQIHVAYVGDSRAYLYSGGELRQITTDHSVVRYLVESGEITENEARNHPQRNLITRALGAEPAVEVDFVSEGFVNGDILLLCSDGLTNHVTDKQIAAILEEGRSETAARRLVDAANKLGGSDNISVVLIY